MPTPILCSILHVAEIALAILAGVVVIGPLIALRLLRSWWGGNAR